ncbi:MAG: type I-F CRISPR-associated helicase Cas3 [Legionella sp.]|nr:MAG: type I-F CRISPR-associated helicase Cas3 [Legionella sp.]PJD98429.1 MAG: type I-F CRISPR-associated helicase Cas3 [Legionella sp.]
MMVIFISQCQKKALGKTRQILDAFANRIGDKTWQTVITQEGLLAVKKLLRQTASKNTSVSCHWIRTRQRTELAWIVGRRQAFNSQGIVPVNSTQKNLLSINQETDWYYLPLIKALVSIAALLHDWGKASALFQQKLMPKRHAAKGDPIRHEWISCLLLHSLVHAQKEPATDDDWLNSLVHGIIDEATIKKMAESQTRHPLANLPPIAKLISWLVVSHHRLPINQDTTFTEAIRKEEANDIDAILNRITQQWSYENRYDEIDYQARVAECFRFPHGLLSKSKPWLAQLKKWSSRLLLCKSEAEQSLRDGSYRLLLNHARLCLMLGDHYYSSQAKDERWEGDITLFANTDPKTKQQKQKLDEHLVGVAHHALKIAHLLPVFETELPLAQDLFSLKKTSPHGYEWQDKAVTNIKKWYLANPNIKGFFAVNMASTGCGKTFANAKIMQVLSKDQSSLRFILALSLRTLTLQTGDEYRKRIKLDDSELAVLIGSKAVMDLHQQTLNDEKKDSYEHSGSLSQESLLNEDIDFDCPIPEENFTTVLKEERDKKFLYAPVLACTIDHLIASVETKRGGRYILPYLRLMSSDLVIDEVDEFSGNDLQAIGRLIHLAGMLGRKVMISSATIPPDLAEGYFKAYRDGWHLYCKTRPINPNITCTWIDEFNTQVNMNDQFETAHAISSYREAHKNFVDKRISKLKKQIVKRKAIIQSCATIFADYTQEHNDHEIIKSKQQHYFSLMTESAFQLHQHHQTIDRETQLKVSFGIIRLANIQPCIAFTQYLLQVAYPNDIQIRVMPYHSQQVLLLRHVQEQHLDNVLKRKEQLSEQPQAFSNPIIKKHLQHIRDTEPHVKNVLFILVATPVEEIGRDHDFDWAVVEPSSYRSIIQLAGRVLRHRQKEITTPNIYLMQYNWKGIKYFHKENHAVFNRPGYEDIILLNSHDMNTLVDTKALAKRIDAIPRIQKPIQLKPTEQLADLEHFSIRNLLATRPVPCLTPYTLQGYLTSAWFLTAYPQTLMPFRNGLESIKIFLIYDEESNQYLFAEKNDQGILINRERFLGIQRIELSPKTLERLWLVRNFETEVKKIAEQYDMSLKQTSTRFGELSFPHINNAKYGYSDQLGLVRLNEQE